MIFSNELLSLHQRAEGESACLVATINFIATTSSEIFTSEHHLAQGAGWRGHCPALDEFFSLNSNQLSILKQSFAFIDGNQYNYLDMSISL